MKVIHIVRDNFTPDSLNGVYKVIDSLAEALERSKMLGGVKSAFAVSVPWFMRAFTSHAAMSMCSSGNTP